MIVRPKHEARGHTGYLTVARKIVQEPEELEAVQEEIEAEQPQTLESDNKATGRRVVQNEIKSEVADVAMT